ncbi:hypothetical protein BDP55DRAFT_154114 [Colletotrichum godetiae]|uniref:Uncharacterized protein n=1 Tax=Colletotrichum godetiae TaxID=1209918 RepID=A0AAJ0ALI3_9PEZI|nr:uncharacterized protein BDP55DRAFT_154114 [Colletotrichum godetiae]KAK1675425.1 hypothetical protein BDP55DRAFT_154114 [Colletotrichum godetiae]
MVSRHTTCKDSPIATAEGCCRGVGFWNVGNGRSLVAFREKSLRGIRDRPKHAATQKCYCGQGGMNVVTDPCVNCGYSRCSRCRVEKLHVRQHLHHDTAHSQHTHHSHT